MCHRLLSAHRGAQHYECRPEVWGWVGVEGCIWEGGWGGERRGRVEGIRDRPMPATLRDSHGGPPRLRQSLLAEYALGQYSRLLSRAPRGHTHVAQGPVGASSSAPLIIQ